MQPQKYERTTDFTERDGDDTDHTALNDEFDAAALSINQVRENLALIQRDDGALKNGIVTADALDPSAFDAVQASVNEATQEAQTAAESALTSATTANNAKEAALVAKTGAETARDASILNANSSAASAQAASTSKDAAALSEAGALASQNAAAASENSAEAAEAGAVSAKNTAVDAKVAAEAAKASAESSATTATAQAGIATTKAGEAQASASAAAASAVESANSAAAAAAALDNFDDRYLGSKANPPTVDNDGNQLIAGALYYNNGTVVADNKGMWVFDGAQWIKASAAAVATMTTYEYVASNNQTVLTGADANGLVLTYTAGNIAVMHNGSMLRPGDEYTATDGTSVNLAFSAASNDEFLVIALTSFSIADVQASAVKFSRPETGAVIRSVESRLRDVISVKDFGAVGDGVHDDTAAIQAAINAATASTTPSAIVFFPPNLNSQVYKITAPLVCSRPVTLRGSGPLGTVVMAFGLSAGQYVIDCDNAVSTSYHYEIEDISFWSNNGLPNGIHIKNCSYTKIKNVLVRNLVDGVYIEGTVCFSNFFENLIGYACSGRTVRIKNFSGGGQYKFDRCTFTGTTGFALDGDSFLDGLCFTNCNFEQCATNSVYIGGGVNGLSFFGCRTEGCDGAVDFQINPVTGRFVGGLTITGCSFETDAGACIPIFLGSAGGLVRGFSITGNHGGYAGNPYFVYLNGEGESGIIAGNSTTYSTSIVNVKRTNVVVFANEYTNGGGGKNSESWGAATWAVEQGGWTPIDASGAGLTFPATEGIYQRLGNMIYFQAAVQYPTTSNGSTAVIGGLPAISYGGSFPVGRAGANVSFTDSTANALLLLTGTTTFRPQNNFTSLTNATMSGKTMWFSGMYRIA